MLAAVRWYLYVDFTPPDIEGVRFGCTKIFNMVPTSIKLNQNECVLCYGFESKEAAAEARKKIKLKFKGTVHCELVPS